MSIALIPILKDNYCYVLRSGDKTALIDPGDAEPILEYLSTHDLKLDYILNTHHHWDHTDGNLAVKMATGARVIGPEDEAARIPGIDEGLKDGDVFQLGDDDLQVFATPGHTLDHIIFYWPEQKAVFTGDTLFSMGTGRLFEGTAEHLYQSMQVIRALPVDTMMYCGHEYTIANAKFCLGLEPENKELQARYEEVKSLRRDKQPTLPVSLKTELATNPFLRAENAFDLAELRRLKEAA